ncbi:MAG: IS1/IS6 family transposase [SAR202 cluster bacterium]|nr:IS1/IS6 family transposase [SAR202 cluster bacterium]
MTTKNANDVGVLSGNSKLTTELTPCPVCESARVVRYGKSRKGEQVYRCLPCGRTFMDKGTMPGRRIPPPQVGAAIAMFYNGMSIEEIRRNLAPIFDITPPSKATIYEWVVDYTKLAKAETAELKPNTGGEWVADELVARIGGEQFWIWSVMDSKTRYVLASRISKTRTTTDAEALFKEAKNRAATLPKTIKTDGLRAYQDGIERVFGGDVKHVVSKGIRHEINNNLAERLQGTIRQREKTMRGLQSLDTANLMMDGWRINYNYFRPHDGLDGKTPAEAGRVESPFENWEDVARRDVRPFSHRRSQMERGVSVGGAGAGASGYPVRTKRVPSKPKLFRTGRPVVRKTKAGEVAYRKKSRHRKGRGYVMPRRKGL